MSNEINITVNMTVANGNFDSKFNSGTIQIDQSAVGATGSTVAVTTSDTSVTFPDVTTYGILLLENLEDSGGNFITYGPDAAAALVPFGKILPGEVHVLRLVPGITYRWQADTATVQCRYELLED